MIGVAVITYERFDRFRLCLESLFRCCRDVSHIVVVEDGSTFGKSYYDKFLDEAQQWLQIGVFRNTTNLGVGAAKNIGMKHLLNAGCNHIFTVEDDTLILSPDVFSSYISAASETKFEYLNFAHQGPANLQNGVLVNYNGYPLALYPSVAGAFTYHSRRLIESVGYHDEKFFNAWEHYEYCYRSSLVGLTAPFWQFADVANSHFLLREQDGSTENSSICHRPDWRENVEKGKQYFLEKHGVGVHDIPKTKRIGQYISRAASRI